MYLQRRTWGEELGVVVHVMYPMREGFRTGRIDQVLWQL